MKLFKITKNGSLHFELGDGRIGVTYTNGYVRVSTKNPNRYSSKTPVYQINKLLLKESDNHGYYYKRELIPNHIDRIQHLMNFNNKNCKN